MTNATYHTDYWSKDDFLQFSDFRPVLGDILTNAETPLSIGVFGAWGSGKTTLLRMLQHDIEARGHHNLRTVWFTAWKYDKEEALWRALLLRVIDALYPREDTDDPWHQRPKIPVDQLGKKQIKQVDLLQRLEESIYQRVTWQESGNLSINWWQALSQVGKGGAEIAAALFPPAAAIKPILQLVGGDQKVTDEFDKTSSAIRKELFSYHRQQLASMEQFEYAFQEAINLVLGNEGKLIVFVDDLDRCLPEKALEVLETIKLFLEVKGAAFVLGMDKELIEKGIETRYNFQFRKQTLESKETPISGDEYLQKIIQIPFYLPPMGEEDILSFIESLEKGGSKDEAIPKNLLSNARKELLTLTTKNVFSHGVSANPRQIKRVINIFRLLQSIALIREYRGNLPRNSVAWPLLAKTVVIQTQFPEVYTEWRREPNLIPWLEETFADKQNGSLESNFSENNQNPEQSIRWRHIEPFVKPENWQKYILLERMLAYPRLEVDQSGRDQACFRNLAPEDIAIYLRLSGSTAMEIARASLIGDYWQSIDNGDLQNTGIAIKYLKNSAPKNQLESVRWMLTRRLQEQAELTPQVIIWAKALNGLGYTDQAISFLDKLKCKNQELKLELAKTLHDFGSSSIPLLRKLYTDGDNKVKHAVIHVVGEIASPDALDFMIDKVFRKDKLTDSDTLEAIQRCFRNANDPARQKTIQKLKTIKLDTVTNLLIDLIDDENPEIRINIINILASSKVDEVLQPIADTFFDRDDGVRKTAYLAFSQFGEQALEFIIEKLCEESDNTESVQSYISALEDMGYQFEIVNKNKSKYAFLFKNETEAYANLLVSLLENRSEKIRDLIKNLLLKKGFISPYSLIGSVSNDIRNLKTLIQLIVDDEKTFQQWMDSIAKDQRIQIATLLPEIDNQHAAGRLFNLLSDNNDDVRKATLESLGNMGTKNINTLLPYLQHDRPEIRSEAASIIGQTGNQDAIKQLKILVKNDKNKAVRDSAKEAIDLISYFNAVE